MKPKKTKQQNRNLEALLRFCVSFHRASVLCLLSSFCTNTLSSIECFYAACSTVQRTHRTKRHRSEMEKNKEEEVRSGAGTREKEVKKRKGYPESKTTCVLDLDYLKLKIIYVHINS